MPALRLDQPTIDFPISGGRYSRPGALSTRRIGGPMRVVRLVQKQKRHIDALEERLARMEALQLKSSH